MSFTPIASTTAEAIKHGGALAQKGAVILKVAKPNQDMRFDVPVIGVETIRSASEARLRAIEAGKTLLLERDAVVYLAQRSDISLIGR
jgi:UDP-2,3-diacylglucosamine hydrolase